MIIGAYYNCDTGYSTVFILDPNGTVREEVTRSRCR